MSYPIIIDAFESDTLSSYSDDVNPEYLVQLTDLHLVDALPERTTELTSMLRNISNHFNPMITVITGDLVDASETGVYISFRDQYLSNWEEYNKTIFESGILQEGRLFIPIAGNHDLMHVGADTPSENPYRGYAINNTEPYIIRTYTTEQNHYIAFHPVIPPMVSEPIGVIPYVDEETLEQLENSFDEYKSNILLVHYPYYSLWSGRTKKGNTIDDLVKRSNAIITGHYHPTNPEITRFSNTLSLVSTTPHSNPNFSMTIIDQGQISIHYLDSSNQETIVISYPVSSSQITGRHSFHENNFTIRAILFSPSYDSVSVVLDGVYLGDMQLLREFRENVYLLKFQINVTDGEHMLTIRTNNTWETISFFVGLHYGPVDSGIKAIKFYFQGWLVLVITIIVFLYALLRVIPFWRIPMIAKMNYLYTEYMYYRSDDLQWWQLIYMGPIWFFTRLRYASPFTMLVLLFLSIWYVFLPIFIAPTGGPNALVFAWGMLLDGKIKSCLVVYMVWLTYIVFYQLPILSIVGILLEEKPIFFETIPHILLVLAYNILWFLVGSYAGKSYTLLISPISYILTLGTLFVILRIYIDKNDVIKMKSDYQTVGSMKKKLH